MATIQEAISLALTYHRAGDLPHAEEIYRQVLGVFPCHAETLHLLGVISHQRGQHDAAANLIQQAIVLDGSQAHYQGNLGQVFRVLRRFPEAIACYQRALQLQPDLVDLHYNLGGTWHDLGQYEDAIACYRRALQLRPGLAEAHYGLAGVWREQGRLEEAIAGIQRALQINPEYVEAHVRRAELWLLSGDFSRGWPEYQWRWRLAGAARPQFPSPWDGQSLRDRTILLDAGQSPGDAIQFLRFTDRLRQQGARVVVACPPSLGPLVSHCRGVDQVVLPGERPPPFDVSAHVSDLPCLLRIERDSIPVDVPCLAIVPEARDRCRSSLANLEGFKVGIAWRGGHDDRPQDSIPLSQFAPLAELPGVCLVALQDDASVDPSPLLKASLAVPKLRCNGEPAESLTETAAVMAQLDLVIAADSTAAHLAGALGVPVWVALPFIPEWRWLLGRDDSPWYPSMRLFRQAAPGDWAGLLRSVAESLAKLVAEGRPPQTSRTAESATNRGREPADLPREPRTSSPQLDRRAMLAADLVPVGAKVLGLGPYTRGLERQLPLGATYVPVDDSARDEQTVVADFCHGRLPRQDGVSLVVALGVMECVADVRDFLAGLRTYDVPVVLSYRPVDTASTGRPSPVGRTNFLPEAELHRSFAEAGFRVTTHVAIDSREALYRLAPSPHAAVATKKVVSLSFMQVGNFGDRMGIFLLNHALPPHAVVAHAYFDVDDGYRPTNVPDGEIDLLVLGIGNSMFQPVLTDALEELVGRAKKTVGIFGTQYREEIDRTRFQRLLARLDIWFARFQEDLLLYGDACPHAIHLGDWLIDAFPMAEGFLPDTLTIGAEQLEQLPLDRMIEKIQSHRRVLSCRLHPLLCALTSAEEVAYRKERESGTGLVSGKFRSMMIDVFGRDYPEAEFFRVDKAAVVAYKTRVHEAVLGLEASLAQLLK